MLTIPNAKPCFVILILTQKSFTIIIVILLMLKMFIFNLCVYQINVIMAINMSVRYSFMIHLS